jgi:hypothetical protein
VVLPHTPQLALVLSLGLALACTKPDPEPDASAATPIQPQTPEPSTPAAPTPTPSEAPATPAPAEPAAPVAEPLPPVPSGPTPIRPIAGVVEWKVVEGVNTITGFRPFVIGLMAECGADNCKLRDDNGVEPDATEIGFGDEIWGIWRSDAWRVTIDAEMEDEQEEERNPDMIVTTRYERLRGSKFVKQYETVEGVDPNSYDAAEEEGTFGQETFRKGWAGGLLVLEKSKFLRVPDSAGPAITLTPPADMAAFFEAESGAMVLVRVDSLEDPKQFSLHGPCAGCSERVLQLPAGAPGGPRWMWDFPLDVARGGDALTIVAVATIGNDDDAEERAFLIHYDPPGVWHFEALQQEIEGEVSELDAPELLWPDTKGGIWLELQSSLYYRSVDGLWFEVDSPGELGHANRLKPRELLALAKAPDGTTILHATRGVPKPAPPESEEAEVPEAAPTPEGTPAPAPTPMPMPEGTPTPTPTPAPPAPEPAPTPAPAPA